jgi:hypothetical protein
MLRWANLAASPIVSAFKVIGFAAPTIHSFRKNFARKRKSVEPNQRMVSSVAFPNGVITTLVG